MKAVAILSAAAGLALAGAVAVAQTSPSAPPTAPAGSQTPPAAPSPAQGGSQTPAAAQAAPAAPQEPRPRLTRADREALTDARIAGIQAGLKLTADQQRLWSPVEQAIRAQAAARIARIEERLARLQEQRQRQEQRQGARPDLLQRLEQRAERVGRRADQIEKRAETLQALVAALRPFWATLSEDQRRILPVLMRDRESRRAGRERYRGPMHHGMHPHGQHPAMPRP
jgi:hypothetical protein